MPWLDHLVSLLGISASAGLLAGTLYAGCVAAESVARPEALRDISFVLKTRSLTEKISPSAIIEKIFQGTFGGRHLSIKCLARSILASIVFLVCSALLVHAEIHKWPSVSLADITNWDTGPFIALIYLMAGLLPDYVALAKTRLLLRQFSRARRRLGWLVLADLLLSLLISYIFLEISNVPEYMLKSGNIDDMGYFRAALHSLYRVGLTYTYDVITAGEPTWIFSAGEDRYPIAILFLLSTLCTSIWTAVLGLSVAVLRAAPSLQRISLWFFDVDAHPIQAIGIMAGALVLACGFVWSVARTLVRLAGEAIPINFSS
jgi:hypothetical protein